MGYMGCVWLVFDPDHPDTPIGGVFTSYKLACEHCHGRYVIMKILLDFDHTARAA